MKNQVIAALFIIAKRERERKERKKKGTENKPSKCLSVEEWINM